MHSDVHVAWDAKRVPAGDIQLEDGGEWKRDKPLPYGYHTLHDGSLVICAPRKGHPVDRRTWGLFVPLYAAHTRAKKTGDLGVLRQYLDWTRGLGGSIVATLPLLASFEDEPSPYSPVSRLFWNERYLDPERVDDSEPDAAFVARTREYAEFRARIHPSRSADEHIRLQWQMSRQMASLPKEHLYLDFPLGVNGGGYDVAKYPNVFAKGYSVGAPPDSFFTKGQNWGFPPYDVDGIRGDHYEYFRAAIQQHMKHAGILRLDHVMGLHRLFWIPEGGTPQDGKYVRYREEELYAILTLESRRNRCALVGEDLGTVPKYVPGAMQSHGLRRMFVVQYEAKPAFPPLSDPPRTSVAGVNTHDMPTFAAFWRGLDIDDRVQQSLLDEEGAHEERETRAQIRESLKRQLGIDTNDELEVLEALLLRLGRSDAEVVLVNLEDLWRETQPQNVPGVPERSWKQRFRLSLEEADDDVNVMRILRALNGARALLQNERER
jgi:4-alpha-glucanotransferase